MTISKNNKMMAHINYRMKIMVQDQRTFIGYFKAFDKHMNVILAECEESRRVKPKAGKKTTENEERRVLGLVLLRGDIIVSVSVDGPPMKEADASKLPARAGGHGGPGMAMSAGRGMPMGIAPGLQGAVAGIGGPGYQAMQPGYGGRPL